MVIQGELYRLLIYNHQEMKIGRVIKEDNSVVSDITVGSILSIFCYPKKMIFLMSKTRILDIRNYFLISESFSVMKVSKF